MQQKISPTKTSPQLNKSNEIKSDPFDRSTPINKIDEPAIQQQHINDNTNLTSFYNPQFQYLNDYNSYGFTANSLSQSSVYQNNNNVFDHTYQNTLQKSPPSSNSTYWRPTQPTQRTDYFQNANYSNIMNGLAQHQQQNYNNIDYNQRTTTVQFDNFFNYMHKTTTTEPSSLVKIESQQPSLLASQLQAPALNTEFSDLTNATSLLYSQPQQQQQQRISPSSSTTSSSLYLNNQFNYNNSSPISSLNLLANTCSSTSSSISNTNRSCSDTNSEQLNDTHANITPINSSGSSSSPSASDTNNGQSTFDWMKPIKNPSNGKL
jgi:hypothetical protein